MLHVRSLCSDDNLPVDASSELICNSLYRTYYNTGALQSWVTDVMLNGLFVCSRLQLFLEV